MLTPDLKQVSSVVHQILTRLAQLPDPSTPRVRSVRRELTKRLATADPEVVLEIARRLIARPGFEHRFLAYELISNHKEAMRRLGEKDLVEFANTLDSWGAVDTFALYLAGPAWREHQVKDSVIERWTRSSDRWWRRAALVSTVPLNSKARGGTGDTKRTLKVCHLLMADRDDMVVKALSWALRELAERDPQAVQRLLAKYANAFAARVLREVRNKLATGLKNPRRKS